MRKLFLFCLSVVFLSGNAQKAVPVGSDKTLEDFTTSIATQTYIYGSAIMTSHYFRNRMQGMVKASLENKQKINFSENVNDGIQLNELIHVQNLTTHEVKSGTSPNEDTFYSVLFLELKKEPQVFTIPPIKNRYFSVQIADAYLENQPYICSRLGDVNGGSYVFVGPDWKGKLPKNCKAIPMPHNNGMVLIRILIRDEKEEKEEVKAIQSKFSIVGLSHHENNNIVDTEEKMPLLPKPIGLDWYKVLLDVMRENPPLKRDEMILRQMEMIGLKIDGTTNIDSLSEPIKKGLLKGIEIGKEAIQWKIKEGRSVSKSNWVYSYDVGVLGADYLLRASWAVQGLLVNSKEEAMYINCYFDKNGERLNGKHQYTIHIPKEKINPTNAFWSITSYDDNFDFVPNSYFHYSVSGRKEGGVKTNKDGSITLKLQNEPPKEGLSNWIPTPLDQDFKLNIRYYNPKEFLFNKETLEEYLPPVIKMDNPIDN